MKILYITNIPSPYRVRYFNLLSEQCELTVLYEKGKSDERNEQWIEKSNKKYEEVFLKGISTSVDQAMSIQVLKYLKRDFWDYIVICGISSPTEVIAIEWCKICKIPYCIEGDGAFVKTGTGIRERVKRRLIKDAFLCFSTCSNHDEYYMKYGADKEKIVRYPFSSIMEKDIDNSSCDYIAKKKLRDKLNMKEETIIVSVGQFIYRKGFDLLIQAAKDMPQNVGVYIVGGEASEEYLKLIKEMSLMNVTFVGFKSKEELKNYYQAADFFVLPTREDIWGLVVNEAMASGLPCITTNRCNAGLELIKEGENGYIVPVDDVQNLNSAMKKMLDTAEGMREATLEIIKKYTVESMVATHMQVFRKSERI